MDVLRQLDFVTGKLRPKNMEHSLIHTAFVEYLDNRNNECVLQPGQVIPWYEGQDDTNAYHYGIMYKRIQLALDESGKLVGDSDANLQISIIPDNVAGHLVSLGVHVADHEMVVKKGCTIQVAGLNKPEKWFAAMNPNGCDVDAARQLTPSFYWSQSGDPDKVQFVYDVRERKIVPTYRSDCHIFFLDVPPVRRKWKSLCEKVDDVVEQHRQLGETIFIGSPCLREFGKGDQKDLSRKILSVRQYIGRGNLPTVLTPVKHGKGLGASDLNNLALAQFKKAVKSISG